MHNGVSGAVVDGRVYGGDTQHLQIALGRGVGEQDAVMSRQPALLPPRWPLFFISVTVSRPPTAPAVRAMPPRAG
jgi:hypothetical protein